MQVTSIEVKATAEPTPKVPTTDAWRANRFPGRISVTVRTDDGLEASHGIYVASINGAPEVLKAMVDHEIAPLLVGRDPWDVRRLAEEVKWALEEQGITGLSKYAWSAVDPCLWDLCGQAADMPVHRLLGTAVERVPAYAMAGWYQYDMDQLEQAVEKALSSGFRAVKVKVGFPTLDEDMRRLELVRRTVGSEVAILVDANQSLSLAEAKQRAEAFREIGCAWLEEPLLAHDYVGYGELAHSTSLPIAGGENLYGKEEIRELLMRRGVSVLQGDLWRCGGFTELVDVGLFAAAMGVPYCTHGGGAVKLNALFCVPNAMYCETGGNLRGGEQEIFEDGAFRPPRGPGFRV